jgi:probable phosphoglycerate mutase
MTHITIVRHGTTEWMERGLTHGVRDSRLSALGREQAQLVAARLKQDSFDAFYTSPAGRAVETARIIAAEIGMQPVILEGLREIDFGWMEGKPLRLFLWLQSPLWGKFGQALRFYIRQLSGERWSQVKERVLAALQYIVEQRPAGHVLVVTHNGTHNAILEVALNESHSRPKIRPFAPCAITEIEVDSNGRGHLIALNQAEHLG